MQLEKNEKQKLFEIWLTKAEKQMADKNGSLVKLIDICNQVGYKPVVYVSGNNDIIAGTTAIINRKINEKSVA